MLDYLDIQKVLFLDIETVPMCDNYEGLPDRLKQLWDKKAGKIIKNEDDTPESIFPRAGIYAEFGKIVCISVGFIKGDEFRVKSYFGDDEKVLLEEFSSLLTKYYSRPDQILCAHNGKEFDFPYIARRLLINGLKIPSKLNTAGKKPWEVTHLDTLELWKFGDYKSFTSLELLTAVFDIPTPKDDIDGSEVWRVYWEEKNLDRIVIYCQKDVLSIAQLMLKYLGKELIADDKVISL